GRVTAQDRLARNLRGGLGSGRGRERLKGRNAGDRRGGRSHCVRSRRGRRRRRRCPAQVWRLGRHSDRDRSRATRSAPLFSTYFFKHPPPLLPPPTSLV